MAQRSRILIVIGGNVTPAQVSSLCEIANETGLHPKGTIGDVHAGHFKRTQAVELESTDAVGGEAATLEAYCQGEGIAFVRETAGYPGEWLAERVVFDGAGVPDSYETNEEGKPVIDAATASELGSFEAIEAHLRAAERKIAPLAIVRPDRRPTVGATYESGPDVLRQSLGLPRKVTRIETKPDLAAYVVHFETEEGTGFCSGNVWEGWVDETGATPPRT